MNHSEIRARIALAVREDEPVATIPEELWDAVRECLHRHEPEDTELVEYILTTTEKAPYWLRQQALAAGYRQWYKIKEFAAMLGITPRTVSNHIEAGLPVHKRGGKMQPLWIDYEEALMWYWGTRKDSTARSRLRQIAESRIFYRRDYLGASEAATAKALTELSQEFGG